MFCTENMPATLSPGARSVAVKEVHAYGVAGAPSAPSTFRFIVPEEKEVLAIVAVSDQYAIVETVPRPSTAPTARMARTREDPIFRPSRRMRETSEVWSAMVSTFVG